MRVHVHLVLAFCALNDDTPTSYFNTDFNMGTIDSASRAIHSHLDISGLVTVGKHSSPGTLRGRR